MSENIENKNIEESPIKDDSIKDEQVVEKHVEIKADGLIFIKATEKKDITKENRHLKRKCDALNAKVDSDKQQKKIDIAHIPTGGAVIGKLSLIEQQALMSGNDAVLSRCAAGRIREIMKNIKSRKK